MLQPGDVQVIENGVPEKEWFDLAVRTALIRGWVEVLEIAPTGALKFADQDVSFPRERSLKTHYRLTEAGWAVLNRTQFWVLATFAVSLISLIITIVSLYKSKY